MDTSLFLWFIVGAVTLFLALSLFFSWKEYQGKKAERESLIKLRTIEGCALGFVAVMAGLNIGIDVYRRLKR